MPALRRRGAHSGARVNASIDSIGQNVTAHCPTRVTLPRAMAKTLHMKGSGKLILRMNDAQFADLERLLEEESTKDRDYYVDGPVLEFMEQNGADRQLVQALRRAIEDKRTAYRDPATPEPTQADDADGDG